MMLPKKDVVRRDWWSFPNILGTLVERTAIDDVLRDFSKEGSPLFLCEGLILACRTQGLSN